MKIAGTHYFCVFIAWQLVGACQAILWNGKGLHLGVRSGPMDHWSIPPFREAGQGYSCPKRPFCSCCRGHHHPVGDRRHSHKRSKGYIWVWPNDILDFSSDSIEFTERDAPYHHSSTQHQRRIALQWQCQHCVIVAHRHSVVIHTPTKAESQTQVSIETFDAIFIYNP